jgi:hypothetical protein
MTELPRKRSRHHTLSIRSSGGTAINLRMGLSVYGLLTSLSLPAMATECERTFSSAKKLIPPERNALSDTTIEASDCLRAWCDQGLITRDQENYDEKSGCTV